MRGYSHILATQELALYHGNFVVRDASQASSLKLILANAPNWNTHENISLDLARLPDVRKTAESIRIQVAGGEVPPIRALVLAAGHIEMGQQSETAEGLGIAFGSNI
ncbi:Short-chain dehydrogenase iccH [Paramyrothecium foliicola]|nr:Short-chain dehydrogenase iccH [Paramyrothecium foliicola]